MTDKYILDDAGRPVPCDDLTEWGRWFESGDRRRVAVDKIGDALISTIFLGIDHRFTDGMGEPILWETMIFGGEHDQYQDRYTSRDAALKGHADAVAMVKA